MKHTTSAYDMPSKPFLACMNTCGDCAAVCFRCAHHCLHMGGDHASPAHQGLMADCYEICDLTACLLGRASPHAVHLCRECAEVCTLCATECAAMAGGDAMMKQCAAACRHCAKACKKMAGARSH